jgi:hypothetical protein
MGQHIKAVCQRQINGKWRNLLDIPCSPVRLEWYTYVHYVFLAYEGCVMADGSVEFYEPEDSFSISRARGYPEGYDPEQAYVVKFWDPVTKDNPDVSLPWPTYATGGSWLTIDELVNHDYDRIVTRFGETKPLREFLGEEFIQFWRDAKAKGAERLIFCVD